jgi:alkaline phosphatase D
MVRKFFPIICFFLIGCSTRIGLAPQPTSPQVRTIVFGSCASQDQPQPFWEAIIAQEPDLFLFIGDNIYADTENMTIMRAEYARLKAQPGYQRLRARTIVLATWDDHDYGVNDVGAEYPMKAESQRAFMDFFAVPDSAPMRSRPGIYDAHVFGPEGQRVQVILLDTRYFRGPLMRRPKDVEHGFPGHYVPSSDTTSSMLGEAQWTWLEGQLRQPAEVRLLVSSIQVIAEEHGWEKWANLPHERTRLLQLLRDTQAKGVILLSGDRHLAEISRLDGDSPEAIGYPLYDVTSSGLNRGGGGSDDEPNRHRISAGNFRRNNFGKITIDWTLADPLISLQVLDDSGELALRYDVRLSHLRRFPV